MQVSKDRLFNRPLRLTLGTLLAATLLPLATANAAECTDNGDLADGYCDKNGDLVADTPTDPDKLSNPDTLVFAYTPVTDPSIYADIWQPLIEHVEDVTGKDVRFFAVQSNAAQIEAMRSGRLHIAGFSTGPTPFAVNLAGAVPFAIMGSDDGTFGYKLQLYTQKDSGIDSIQDLKGKRVAHTSPTSNSGNQAPRALFPKEGIEPGEDYEVVYSGSHDQSILGVAAGDYDAAPVASEVVDRMIDRDVIDPSKLKIVYESKSFPTTSYTYAHDLDPKLADKIKKAFMTFKLEGTALGKEFSGVTKFVPITYKEDWEVIRDIQEANGVNYTKDNIK